MPDFTYADGIPRGRRWRAKGYGYTTKVVQQDEKREEGKGVASGIKRKRRRTRRTRSYPTSNAERGGEAKRRQSTVQ